MTICVGCLKEFNPGYDCASCWRYVPGQCNGKIDNEYCTECCVRIGAK